MKKQYPSVCFNHVGGTIANPIRLFLIEFKPYHGVIVGMNELKRLQSAIAHIVEEEEGRDE